MNTAQKNTAKNFNLYTSEDLPKIYTQPQILNGSTFDYSKNINDAKLDLPDALLNNFKPVLLFEAREQKKNNSEDVELYYIEHSYTSFFTPNGNIVILRYDSRNKKYYFMPHYVYFRGVQNVEFSIRERAKNEIGIKEPNYIGKFTDKKVNEWFKYCDDTIKLNEKIVSNNKDKNKEIESKIYDFALKSGGKVSKYANTTEIEIKNFRVRFDHNKGSQFLSTKIDFNGTLEDVLKLLK